MDTLKTPFKEIPRRHHEGTEILQREDVRNETVVPVIPRAHLERWNSEHGTLNEAHKPHQTKPWSRRETTARFNLVLFLGVQVQTVMEVVQDRQGTAQNYKRFQGNLNKPKRFLFKSFPNLRHFMQLLYTKYRLMEEQERQCIGKGGHNEQGNECMMTRSGGFDEH